MGTEYFIETGYAIEYSGLFRCKDLFKEINQLLEKKGYDRSEKENHEKVKSDGKYTFFKMEYNREPTKYVKYIVEVEVTMNKLKKVSIAKGDRKMTYDEADLVVEIKSKIKTDLAGRWQGKPMRVFFGHIIDKYLYPIYTRNEIAEVKADTDHLKHSIKAFLNLYRF